MMEFVFRPLISDKPALPAPGELHLRPQQAATEEPHALASLALHQGPAAFVQGRGPISVIVIQADPTVDDMLAATIVQHRLTDQELPAGLNAFAVYAALAREGLKAADLPLEDSLEGTYLAIRHEAGDLTQAAHSRRFLEDWSRLACLLWEAARKGQDPFTTPLFAGVPDFARTRKFLAHDRDLYEQQDLPGCRRWRMHIPGGPPTAYGLVLRSPKSVLWKHWSRQDRKAPHGKGYLFLGVCEQDKHWRFSTDPLHKVRIDTLAARLQEAEAAIDPQGAAADPWYDGSRHHHTVVGAPMHQGTRLSDREVLRIVRRWAGARQILDRKWVIAALAFLVLVALLIPGVYRKASHLAARSSDGWRGDSSTRLPGEEYPHAMPNLYLLSVGISSYQHPVRGKKIDLKYADRDAEDLVKTFRELKGPLYQEIHARKPLVNQEATHDRVLNELEALRGEAHDAGPDDLVIVTLAGHGDHYPGTDSFCFLPHDFQEDHKLATGVFWDQIKTALTNLPCPVVVVMDTCHSGTITRPDQLPRSQDKMVVIAACLSDEKAGEREEWGHGALTKALLEGIHGHYELSDPQSLALLAHPANDQPQFISLEQLDFYVKQRVAQLAGGGQAVVSSQATDMRLNTIRIGVRQEGPKKTLTALP